MVLAQEAKEAAATRRKEQTDRCSFTAKRIKDKNQEQPRQSSQQEKRRSDGSQGRIRSRRRRRGIATKAAAQQARPIVDEDRPEQGRARP